jgi:hypothetical protein
LWSNGIDDRWLYKKCAARATNDFSFSSEEGALSEDTVNADSVGSFCFAHKSCYRSTTCQLNGDEGHRLKCTDTGPESSIRPVSRSPGSGGRGHIVIGGHCGLAARAAGSMRAYTLKPLPNPLKADRIHFKLYDGRYPAPRTVGRMASNALAQIDAANPNRK